MAVPFRLAACLVLGCCWLGTVLSFNLEPRIPVVKKGSKHSHFGYTVAQHQSFIGEASGGERRKSWILVGAPKDHNLQPGTNRSGALWKCPLTTLTSDCVQVQTDGFRNPETRLYDFDYLDKSLSEPVEDEIKDGQWLGVTLKSQGPGGKVLVCAHRYMHKGPKFQWGYGLCYILTNNLDVMDNLEPCRGKPVNNGHQQYGFCQAGTSGLLLEDEVVLGVPGPFTWRGTVHTSNISDDFLLKDKTQYFGPVTEAESPVDKYSYLGYSVTAGRFFGNFTSYVGGAPRSKETGQVVFFSREKIGNSLLLVNLILDGEMFASSFGYEVLALDINNDGRDDLVVGAPFYYNRVASGAVYIYMNDEGGFREDHPFTKIEGAPGESRFGSSMTSLGDLNRDGYLDVAVGAPYEGRGVIYIFLGSKDGLVTEPAQVIRAEDLPGQPYDAFGYSLSGGMDLDNNGYPDLLTSSFCSDRVLLLRARPIIDIETKVSSDQLNNIDPSRKGCRQDPSSEETCFSFDACFKMDNDAGTRTGLRLHYTIEERVYQDRPLARVRFADSAPEQPNEVHRNIVLRPEDVGLFLCSKENVYLLEGSRDILRPLRFKLTYEIIQSEPRPVPEGAPMPDIDDYPILNQKGALRYFEGTFAKECGDDDVCMSDLHVTASLDLEYSKTHKYHLLRLGEQDTVALRVEVTNSKEPAYETSLLITHDKALNYDPIESEVGVYQCSSTAPGVVKCGIGNPLINTTGPLKLNFKESGNIFDSRFIHFSVYANSSSTELTPQDPVEFRVEVVKRAEISIIGSVTPEQVFYGGEVVGESAIKHFDEIGMEVTHKYVVDNRGPWRVDELQVEVLWPHQVENGREKGKWLLYMTEQPTVDGVGECEVDPRYINPLNLRRPKTYTDAFTGHDVDPEAVTDEDEDEPTDTLTPTDTGDGTLISTGGTKITKTTTSTKKVTSTTIKKTTSKTSSEKEYSSSTRGSTSSSSGFSSSSSSSASSSSSQGSYGDIEGSGYEEDGSRAHGRTHSRFSRRVFTSDRSKFDENENELEGETGGKIEGGSGSGDGKDGRVVESYGREVDKDGRVITHYERTHHASGGSPDGTTTFKKTHHESRKVTVSKEDIPSSRWSAGGGYRRTQTHTQTDGAPDNTHTSWTHTAGQDGGDRLGETDRREETYRQHSSRTQHGYDSTGSQSGTDGLNNYRRTHEGGAVTQTVRGGDGSYYTGGNRQTTRTHTREQEGNDNDRDRFVWTEEKDRTPYDSDRGGHFYRETTRTRSGSEAYPETDNTYGSRRVESSSRWSRKYDSSSSSSSSLGGDNTQGGGGGGGDEADRYTSRQGSYRRSHQERYNDRDADNEEAGAYSRGWQAEDNGGTRSSSSSSSQRFSHMETGDGTIRNGTYTRVEVDPKTGETKTYTSKVVYNRWPTDYELKMAQRDAAATTGDDDLHGGDGRRRTKREKELIIKPQAVTDEKTGKTMQVVHLQCDGPATAKCFTFVCNIRHLGARRTASIQVKSRLWNATLVEDYPRVSYVSIKSKASLILPEDIREDQSQEDDVDSAETLAYPDLLDQLPPEEVPLWVILVSIFAGLLLLILIVLVLWKLGFFERKRPDPTLSGNLDKDANGY